MDTSMGEGRDTCLRGEVGSAQEEKGGRWREARFEKGELFVIR